MTTLRDRALQTATRMLEERHRDLVLTTRDGPGAVLRYGGVAGSSDWGRSILAEALREFAASELELAAKDKAPAKRATPPGLPLVTLARSFAVEAVQIEGGAHMVIRNKKEKCILRRSGASGDSLEHLRLVVHRLLVSFGLQILAATAGTEILPLAKAVAYPAVIEYGAFLALQYKDNVAIVRPLTDTGVSPVHLRDTLAMLLEEFARSLLLLPRTLRDGGEVSEESKSIEGPAAPAPAPAPDPEPTPSPEGDGAPPPDTRTPLPDHQIPHANDTMGRGRILGHRFAYAALINSEGRLSLNYVHPNGSRTCAILKDAGVGWLDATSVAIKIVNLAAAVGEHVATVLHNAPGSPSEKAQKAAFERGRQSVLEPLRERLTTLAAETEVALGSHRRALAQVEDAERRHGQLSRRHEELGRLLTDLEENPAPFTLPKETP